MTITMIIWYQELYNYAEYYREYVIKKKVEQLLCGNRNTKLSIKHIFFQTVALSAKSQGEKRKKASLYDQRQNEKKYMRNTIFFIERLKLIQEI